MATRKKTTAKPAAPEQPRVDAAEVPDEEAGAIDIGALLSSDPQKILEMIASLGPNAAPMMRVLYEGFMSDIRPLIKLSPELMGMVGKDMGPLVASILVALNGLVNSEEMKEAMATVRKTRASNRRLSLDAYMSEGFTREEALTLVLQDVASEKSMVSAATRNTKVSRK